MAKTDEAKQDGFQLYDVKLRLSGSRDNEARRFKVTAPAAMLLAMIHGPESLTECTARPGEFADRTDREERLRLVEEFEGRNAHKRGFVARVFGAPMAGGRLPRTMSKDFQVDEAVSVQKISEDSPANELAAVLA